MKWKSWERLVKLEDEEADLSRWAGVCLDGLGGPIKFLTDPIRKPSLFQS